MTVQETIENTINYLTKDVQDAKNKPFLSTALKSHCKQWHENIPPESIDIIVDGWFDSPAEAEE